MKNTLLACLAMAGGFLACGAARAGTIEDFQFSDANGTVITSAVNSGPGGHTWLSQNTAINAGVQSGSFRIQKGGEATPVPGQVSNTFDIANITSGKAWLVANIAGWFYTETASSTSERVRFGFLDNDPPAAGSSTITAELNIDRLASGNLTITADAGGTGATAAQTSAADFSRTRSTPLQLVMAIDADADTYTAYYKDGAGPYVSLGLGSLGERSAGVKREARSVRFAFTGTYSEAGEFVDVDRIYVTDVNPVPEPGTALLAAVAAFGLLALRPRTS